MNKQIKAREHKTNIWFGWLEIENLHAFLL